MADYQVYWNSEKETLSESEYRFVQEKAFLKPTRLCLEKFSLLPAKIQ